MFPRFLSRFLKRSTPHRVPSLQQIEPRRPRLLIPALIAISAAIAGYLAWPDQNPTPPPIISSTPAPVANPLIPLPTPAEPQQAEVKPPIISDRRQAKTIHIGPRGGRYHYSASGKKVYEHRK